MLVENDVSQLFLPRHYARTSKLSGLHPPRAIQQLAMRRADRHILPVSLEKWLVAQESKDVIRLPSLEQRVVLADVRVIQGDLIVGALKIELFIFARLESFAPCT